MDCGLSLILPAPPIELQASNAITARLLLSSRRANRSQLKRIQERLHRYHSIIDSVNFPEQGHNLHPSWLIQGIFVHCIVTLGSETADVCISRDRADLSGAYTYRYFICPTKIRHVSLAYLATMHPASLPRFVQSFRCIRFSGKFTSVIAQCQQHPSPYINTRVGAKRFILFRFVLGR